MKFNQVPHSVLMVRPASFNINDATSDDSNTNEKDRRQICDSALREFDEMIEKLRAHDIEVIVFEDAANSNADAVFSNLISTHEDGRVIIYPSSDEEFTSEIIKSLQLNFQLKDILDLSRNGHDGRFQLRADHMIFDHTEKIVYAALTDGAGKSLVEAVAQKLMYRTIFFHALKEDGSVIENANFVLCIGRQFAIICLDAIQDDQEQETIISSLNASGRKIVAISFAQKNSFAGNVIEVQSRDKQPVVLMSETAFQALLPGQINAIENFADILTFRLNNIEKYSKRSVRCMVTGIHLPV